ncbi:MAG: prepilin-type N-terminal cleavage/methylation domain-containing protein [Patescibacteria group bacterium]
MSKAFTLIEILITISIAVVLLTTSFLGLSGYRRNQSLDLSSKSITAVLRDSQTKSMTQQSSKQWGAHFENTPAGRDFYEIFSGANYAAASEKLEKVLLPPGIEFSSPTQDVIFAKVTGLPLSGSASNVTIMIAGDPASSKTISINEQGAISN